QRVVNVNLSAAFRAGSHEQVAQRIAQCSRPAVHNDDRTGRIRADEFDEYLLACARVIGAVLLVLLLDSDEGVVQPGWAQVEVEESGTGNLDAVDQAVAHGQPLSYS